MSQAGVRRLAMGPGGWAVRGENGGFGETFTLFPGRSNQPLLFHLDAVVAGLDRGSRVGLAVGGRCGGDVGAHDGVEPASRFVAPLQPVVFPVTLGQRMMMPFVAVTHGASRRRQEAALVGLVPATHSARLEAPS